MRLPEDPSCLHSTLVLPYYLIQHLLLANSTLFDTVELLPTREPQLPFWAGTQISASVNPHQKCFYLQLIPGD